MSSHPNAVEEIDHPAHLFVVDHGDYTLRHVHVTDGLNKFLAADARYVVKDEAVAFAVNGSVQVLLGRSLQNRFPLSVVDGDPAIHKRVLEALHPNPILAAAAWQAVQGHLQIDIHRVTKGTF